MSVLIEAMLMAHGLAGSGGGSLSIVSSPTEPTEGLKDGIIWFDTKTNNFSVYINGDFRNISQGMALIPFRGKSKLTTDTSTVEISISDFYPNRDILFVKLNTTFLTEGEHYTIDPVNKRIVKTSGVWSAGSEILFESFAPTPAAINALRYDVVYQDFTLNAGTTDFKFDLPYNPETDLVTVYQENLPLLKNKNYVIGNDNSSIRLSTPLAENQFVRVEIMRKIRSLIADGVDGGELSDRIDSHAKDMAKHNQFINSQNKKQQITFGWNETLGCLTATISEVSN